MADDRAATAVKTILVADDERSLRVLVRVTISGDRRTVLEAADGNVAWELIQERCPDLVLLDIQMPGRSGLELAHAMRSDERLRHIPIVILTAKAQEGDLEAGLAAGADAYLTKPFSPLELIRVVDQVLEAT